ncbi:hypothetical protein HO173_007042 [Letharia columbiana]|uniref:Uncharacterized protein n=1 Tax=Letharia columbiana TaxID=112416 RepID=A0A8H6L427_9LECA|nr:uncharacterized protein HO173_007042 [Letharia columbiana]KAF6234822.1 hypothetical protein HO173_007042 [Letharia columbiana]
MPHPMPSVSTGLAFLKGNQEVSIMGTIYKQARHVDVYLGEADGHDAQAVDSMKLQQMGAFIAETPSKDLKPSPWTAMT